MLRLLAAVLAAAPADSLGPYDLGRRHTFGPKPNLAPSTNVPWGHANKGPVYTPFSDLDCATDVADGPDGGACDAMYRKAQVYLAFPSGEEILSWEMTIKPPLWFCSNHVSSVTGNIYGACGSDYKWHFNARSKRLELYAKSETCAHCRLRDWVALVRGVEVQAWHVPYADPNAQGFIIRYLFGGGLYNPVNGHWYGWYTKMEPSRRVALWEVPGVFAGGLDGLVRDLWILNDFDGAPYVATVTSQAERDFMAQHLGGDGARGWIGASDASQRYEYRWAFGPEGCHYQGRLYDNSMCHIGSEYPYTSPRDVPPDTVDLCTWQSGEECGMGTAVDDTFSSWAPGRPLKMEDTYWPHNFVAMDGAGRWWDHGWEGCDEGSGNNGVCDTSTSPYTGLAPWPMNVVQGAYVEWGGFGPDGFGWNGVDESQTRTVDPNTLTGTHTFGVVRLPVPLNECVEVCETCAQTATHPENVCAAAQQECADDYLLVSGSWTCVCPSPSQDRNAGGAVPVCTVDECAEHEGTCTAVGQACADPNVTLSGDWECRCVLPAEGVPRVGAATSCALDECVEACASCAKKASDAVDVCAAGGQVCVDFAGWWDWECHCVPPEYGAPAVGDVAHCQELTGDECKWPHVSGFCAKHGQNCADPDTATYNNWECRCPPPADGVAVLRGRATCTLAQCPSGCAACQGDSTNCRVRYTLAGTVDNFRYEAGR